jgi:hypothetical protein
MSSSPDTGRDIDLCHGTLVVHLDRTLECTEVACEFPDPLSHTFVIDCRTVMGGCCAAEEREELRAAS